MSELFEKIDKYLFEKGYKEDDLFLCESHSINLAYRIMLYAHRNQERKNGQPYSIHPFQVFKKYRKLVGIDIDDSLNVDYELTNNIGIPFKGVQEVALLHDVVEDTELTFDDIKNLYSEFGLDQYYKDYIAEPLELITHDPKVPYDMYIEFCCLHPVSALVKLIDLQNNSYIFSLREFQSKEYEKLKKYLKAIYTINSRFIFVEKFNAIRKLRKNKK